MERPQPVDRRGQIAGVVEGGPVTPAQDQRRLDPHIIQPDDQRALILHGNTPTDRGLDHLAHLVLVKTLAQRVVESHLEQVVDLLKRSQAVTDKLVPQRSGVRVALLQAQMPLPGLVAQRRIAAGFRVELHIEAEQFPDGVLCVGLAIQPGVIRVQERAELRAPVAQMIVPDRLVAGKLVQLVQRRADDRGPQVSHRHLPGHIGRREVDHHRAAPAGIERAVAIAHPVHVPHHPGGKRSARKGEVEVTAAGLRRLEQRTQRHRPRQPGGDLLGRGMQRRRQREAWNGEIGGDAGGWSRE